MSWINTPQMMLLERYLDVVSMRQTLVSTNVANVDTPGYARQRPELAETEPVTIGPTLTFGTGVELQKVTSLRDSVLDLRVNQETQNQSQLSSFIGFAQQIQSLFNEAGGTGLQSSLSAFSTISPSSLPIPPTSTSVRACSPPRKISPTPSINPPTISPPCSAASISASPNPSARSTRSPPRSPP